VTLSEIIIDTDVILDGEGNLTVDGNDDHRVLSVDPDVTAGLVELTVRGGRLDTAQGAGILNEGTLTITDGIIEWNVAEYAEGGGIYNSGTLTLVNSVVRDNVNYGGPPFPEGSAIYSTGTLTLVSSGVLENFGNESCIYSTGTLTLMDSQVSDNFSADGAAIRASGTLTLINSAVVNDRMYEGIVSSGTATVTNSTVSGSRSYAAIANGGTLTLISSTVLPPNAGAYYTISNWGDMVVSNSVIVGLPHMYSGQVTCAGTGSVVSEGGNIESLTNDCGLTDPTDLVNVSAEDLNLGPLADNGGPTMTHALLPGSVAIDRIPEAMCVDGDGQPSTTDQRGVSRPQGAACDVGAFEYADCASSTCDDGNECTADHCAPVDQAWCAHAALPDGTACDSGGVGGMCIAGQCVETVWGTAVLIDTDTGSAGDPQLAVDPSGNAVAVWSQSGSIWSNRYTSSGGWGTAVLIETNSGSALSPTLAVDPSGNATAVWTQRDNIWSNRYTPSAGWGTVVPIETNSGNGYDPQVAVGPDGNATVVWRKSQGSWSNLYDIWSNRYTPSAGWGTAVLVETNSSTVGAPLDLAVDPDGNAMAVWVQYDGISGHWGIWSNRFE